MTPETKDGLHLTRILNSFLIPDYESRTDYIKREIKEVAKIRKVSTTFVEREVLVGLIDQLGSPELNQENKKAILKVAVSVRRILNGKLTFQEV